VHRASCIVLVLVLAVVVRASQPGVVMGARVSCVPLCAAAAAGTPPYFKLGIYSSSWAFLPSAPPADRAGNMVVYGGVKQGDSSSSYSEVDTSRA